MEPSKKDRAATQAFRIRVSGGPVFLRGTVLVHAGERNGRTLCGRQLKCFEVCETGPVSKYDTPSFCAACEASHLFEALSKTFPYIAQGSLRRQK